METDGIIESGEMIGAVFCCWCLSTPI